MKKYLLILIAVLFSFSTIAYAQVSGSSVFQPLFLLSNGNLNPVNSTWTLGSASLNATFGNLVVNGPATSTFATGINLIGSGCFAINGGCVGGSGGGGTVGSGTIGQTSFYQTNGTTLTATSSIFIASNQNVGIGTSTPGSLFSISGIANFTGATSTTYSTGGINITNGCFAVNGTCTGAGGSGTVTSVAQTVPAFLSVSGSPITTSGTLAITLSGTALPVANGGTGSTTLTSGQPLFGNGTGGILASSTPNFGITNGTTTVTGNLHVTQNLSVDSAIFAPVTIVSNGSITATNFVMTSTSATSTMAYGLNLTGGCVAVNSVCIGAAGGSGTVLSGTTGQTSYYAGAGTTLTATSSIFIDTNQFVGIGTSTPGSLFSIGNIANFTTATSSTYGTGGINLLNGCFAIAGTCVGGGGGGSGTVLTGTTGQLPYYAGAGTTVTATSTIFITTGSKVGIGTTSPTQTFSVNGPINMVGDLFASSTVIFHTDPNSFDSFLGIGAGKVVTSGTQDTMMGYNTGLVLTTGSSNIFSGYNAGKLDVSGSNNAIFGANAGIKFTTGNNTMVGEEAGSNTTSGSDETYIGYNTGTNTINTGSFNSAVGSNALRDIGAGASNSSEGYASLLHVTTGSFDTGVGGFAGSVIVGGSNNSFYGYGADAGSNALTNATAIGYNTIVNLSNSMVFGNAVTTYGFGTSSPFSTLSVTGNSGFIPFAISSTTATNASTTLFMIDKAGDVHYGGGTPVLSSCGTAPSLGANSTDQSGTIIPGAAASGCTITFSTVKLSIPHCIVSPQTEQLTNAISYTETATALTITQTALNENVDYFCPLGH